MKILKKTLQGLTWTLTLLATHSVWANVPRAPSAGDRPVGNTAAETSGDTIDGAPGVSDEIDATNSQSPHPSDAAWTVPDLNQIAVMARIPEPPCDEAAPRLAPEERPKSNLPAPSAGPSHVFSSLWEKLPSHARPSRARLTFYFPAHAKSQLAMEGGIVGLNNRRIYTLDDFLRDPKHVPYVSVAADIHAYGKPGQLLRIRVLEAAFKDQMKAKGIDWIPFCVMDTGSAFRGDGRGHFDISLDQTPDHYPALDKINVSSARFKIVPVGWRMPYAKMPYLTDSQIARWVAALPGGRSGHSKSRRHHSAKKS